MKSINPATNEVLWKGEETSPEEIHLLFTRAKRAYPSWSKLSLDERYNYVKKFKDLLEENELAFAELISQEMGKPLWDAMGEVKAMLGKVDLSYQAVLERCPEKRSEVPLGTSYTRHRAHGVCAVFGPFNFPGHLPNGHIIPALLAGNTLIFKPSELTPLVGIEMCKLWEQAGLPEGVLNLVLGGVEQGKEIAANPLLDGLFFTGSAITGKILSKQFGAHPEKILALEMGGNNPLIVGEIDDVEAAAYMALQSAYLTSGQRCTCARRLILQNNSVVKTLTKMIKTVKIASYDQNPFMGPVVSNEAADKILDQYHRLIEKGAKVILPLERLEQETPFLTCGLIDMTEAPHFDEEIFGPLLQVHYVNSLEHAIDVANNTQYGLAASILTDNDNEYEIFFERIRAGIINRNLPTNGALSSNPFGGVGISGNHRPSAYYAADYCSYPIASVEKERLEPPTKVSTGISYYER